MEDNLKTSVNDLLIDNLKFDTTKCFFLQKKVSIGR